MGTWSEAVACVTMDMKLHDIFLHKWLCYTTSIFETGDTERFIQFMNGCENKSKCSTRFDAKKTALNGCSLDCHLLCADIEHSYHCSWSIRNCSLVYFVWWKTLNMMRVSRLLFKFQVTSNAINTRNHQCWNKLSKRTSSSYNMWPEYPTRNLS